MQAIIYFTEQDALQALDAVSMNIPQGEVRYEGEGPFLPPDLDKPYSTILKHPSKDEWALIADMHVENVLETESEELDESWFPKNAIMQ